MEKSEMMKKYGLEISEYNKRLWVGEIKNGIVTNTLYTDTWGGNRMKGTREKTIENAKLIVKALNAFDSSIDAPYCHDLEQRVELLEMQLEEMQAKAAAYDRLMSGGKKTLKEWANLLGRPVAMDFGGVVESYNTIPMRCDSAGYWYCDEYSENFEDEHFIIPKECFDYTGSWKDSLTLPDSWEVEK